ncbi:Hypothetical protein FKW44_006974 [Caligus rogercresseyi]|uniref:Uncharacterized protein n=1 Tax=Caligus rogercresseyi TaxID=217165 RepID=A0A7T8QT87_CALRO|nr:Hypothetical protein FKW44_006974 [Caligus rogercresseyi]
MDMSIDEDDLDVSMYEEPEEITVNKLQEKIKELEGKLAVTTVERDEARAEGLDWRMWLSQANLNR